MATKEKPVYRLVNRIYYRKDLDYKYMPRGIFRDNKNAYNTVGGHGGNFTASIRVPALNRNNKTWRNFYHLFPELIGKTTFRGCKLKKLKWYYD